jgi:hypothetical protein
MPSTRIRALVLLAVVLVLLAACNFPRPGSTQPARPETVLTFAAQTVQAQLTQAAGELQATLTPGAILPTASPQPGETTTASPPTTTTQGPTPTSEVCDRAAFVEDVNYPDGTIVEAGETFTKTWRLENTGTCTWDSDYAIVFDHGDAMDSPASRSLTDGTVTPGEEIDVSLALTAPDSAGEYQGFWKLRNQAGQVFGLGSNADKEFWVKIRVGVISGITYDFIAQASSAQWVTSGGGEEVTLTYGGALDDPNGAAKVEGGHQLEDGANLGKALLTYPKHNGDGRITGTFSEYTVQDGDHFKGKLGLANDCGDGQVVYQLSYKDSEGTERIREWDEACDGRSTPVDVDLSSLKGKRVQFILVVRADGSSQNDLAIWSSIRIER